LLVSLAGAEPARAGGWVRQKASKGKAPTDGKDGTARARRVKGVASPGAIRAESAGELFFSEPIRYHNLSLVAVGTQRRGPFQRYTLLEEGLERRTLRVRELKGNSGEAEVNAVEVKNRGNLPVYLLGGEMILGGKQDRIIERDTVVDNNSAWTRVAVFCVEQGRWRGRNMKFRSGGALAHVALRRAALSGDQSKVWQEVARKNLRHGTQSATETYRRTIQNATLRNKIGPYRRQLVSKLPAGVQIAGIVFAINGQIRVADLFGNPLLFAALRDKLLSAYILEALDHQVVRNAPAVSRKSAKDWLDKARRVKKRRGKKSGRAVNYDMEDQNTIGSETVDPKAGIKVRETYINKKK
jgi:hypothetical protein